MYEVELKKGGMFAEDTKIYADEVDVTDPFWVKISKFRKPVSTTTSIILPDDEVFKEYNKFDFILFPHHQLGFIGKFKKEEKQEILKVLPSSDE